MAWEPEHWMGLAAWLGLVTLILVGLWATLAIVGRRLRRQQAVREQQALEQAEKALQEWRQKKSPT